MPPRPWLSFFACPSHRRTVPDRYKDNGFAYAVPRRTANDECQASNTLIHSSPTDTSRNTGDLTSRFDTAKGVFISALLPTLITRCALLASRTAVNAGSVVAATSLLLSGCGSKTTESDSANAASCVDTSGPNIKVGALNSLSGTHGDLRSDGSMGHNGEADDRAAMAI